MRAEPGWEVCAPRHFSLVCFRRDGSDEENEALLERVNATGEVFLSHTRLDGRYVLRLAIGNARTTEEDVRAAWDVLRREASARATGGARARPAVPGDDQVGRLARPGGASRESTATRTPSSSPSSPRTRRGRSCRRRRRARARCLRARGAPAPRCPCRRRRAGAPRAPCGRTAGRARPRCAASATRLEVRPRRSLVVGAGASGTRRSERLLLGGPVDAAANAAIRSAHAAASGASSRPCSPTNASPSTPTTRASVPRRPLMQATSP